MDEFGVAERSELIIYYSELGHSVGKITLYLNRAHNIPIRQANTYLYVCTCMYMYAIESAIRVKVPGFLEGYFYTFQS